MGRFIPFEAWHAVDVVTRNGLEEGAPQVFAPEIAHVLAEAGESFSYLVGEDIVACGGEIDQWAGRKQAWMFLAPGSEKHLLAITRRIKDKLEVTPGRVEMTVIKSFEPGHRWAKMLGFEVETPCLRAYGPAGEDHVGYVRINEV